MTKFTSTTDEYFASMSPEEKEKFNKDVRRFAFTDMVVAALSGDKDAVEQLAKLADVPPTTCQALLACSSFKETLQELNNLGFKVHLERHGETITLTSS